MQFVPQHEAWGDVPYGSGIAGMGEPVGVATTYDIGVPAVSYAPWEPHVSQGEVVPCLSPTKKGGVCGMARVYDEDTGGLTQLCYSHWKSVAGITARALVGAGQAFTSAAPEF